MTTAKTTHKNTTTGKQKVYTRKTSEATWLEPGDSFACKEGDEILRVLDVAPEPESPQE